MKVRKNIIISLVVAGIIIIITTSFVLHLKENNSNACDTVVEEMLSCIRKADNDNFGTLQDVYRQVLITCLKHENLEKVPELNRENKSLSHYFEMLETDFIIDYSDGQDSDTLFFGNLGEVVSALEDYEKREVWQKEYPAEEVLDQIAEMQGQFAWLEWHGQSWQPQLCYRVVFNRFLQQALRLCPDVASLTDIWTDDKNAALIVPEPRYTSPETAIFLLRDGGYYMNQFGNGFLVNQVDCFTVDKHKYYIVYNDNPDCFLAFLLGNNGDGEWEWILQSSYAQWYAEISRWISSAPENVHITFNRDAHAFELGGHELVITLSHGEPALKCNTDNS